MWCKEENLSKNTRKNTGKADRCKNPRNYFISLSGGDHWGGQPCASTHLRPPRPQEPRLRARVHERHRRRGSHHSLRGACRNEMLMSSFYLIVFWSQSKQSASIFIYRRPTLYPLEIAVDFLKSL
jgi:hypothetical protein